VRTDSTYDWREIEEQVTRGGLTPAEATLIDADYAWYIARMVVKKNPCIS